ncbi:hypothetical protein PRZ48_004300 [Zasmidium cellare]|uniref:Protein kinase domain-containing protein n=1 Tax=Zasmidium cellare TaxID=395010 RepID=A0ABR0EQF8_ZASCE|nr:hypothetical protein PRZ48_004300 [Zasmidium cellare]
MATDKQTYIGREFKVQRAAIEARGDRITKRRTRLQIEQQWGRYMNAQQRARVAQTLKTALAADEKRTECERAAIAARADALNHPQRNAEEVCNRYAAFQEAVDLYDDLANRSDWSRFSWQQFRSTLQALPAEAQNQDSLDDAQERALAADMDRQDSIVEREMLEPDAQLPDKIPRSWISRFHGKSQGRAEEDNFKILLDHENDNGILEGGFPGTSGWEHTEKYSSGSSSASLWVKRDANRTIIDRLVRKDVMFSDIWFDTHSWAWINFDADNNDAMPWELYCHRLMTSGDNNNNIVRLRETNPDELLKWVDKRYKRWKVYTDFCPYGDLDNLIEHYARNPGSHIPQPFILYVAESLFQAGATMKRVEDVDNGRQVVHRDLKPGNVFLDDPIRSTYPDYYRPRVGDYGFAICTSQDDPRNPDVWAEQRGCCQHDHLPPELMTYADNETLSFIPQTDQLLEHTNVWQAGLILRCLVTLDTPVQAVWLGDGTQDTTTACGTNADDDQLSVTFSLGSITSPVHKAEQICRKGTEALVGGGKVVQG